MDSAQLMKQMLKKLNSSSYYPIRRSFSQTLNSCNIDAVIAFSKISDTKDNFLEQNIEFLVCGLCYNANKQNTDLSNKTRVNFETLLKRLIATDKEKSKPRTAEIENFLRSRLDTNGYFNKKFMSLAKKAIPFINANEIINYEALLDDLKSWNNGNTTKLRWAMTITNIELEEN